MIPHLGFCIRFKQRSPVFAIVSLVKFSSIYVSRVGHFLRVEHVVRSKTWPELNIQVFVYFIVQRQISVLVILVMTSQPFVRHKPWIVVAIVLFIVLLNTYFSRLPVIANVGIINAPVGTTPKNKIVDYTVGPVINIRNIRR